jgi:hypothetical protein
MLSKVKKDLTQYLDRLEKKVSISRDLKDKAVDAVEKGQAEEEIEEFAPPGGGDGDDGFSDETLKRMAAQWWQGDEDPRIERTLAAAGWEIGQDEGYDNGGVFVVQAGDVNGDSYMSWPANELQQGIAEGSQQVDSLVTDALKIMRGSTINDAVAALKTVLGNREYNDRRGHYNFYVRQLMDMYGQQDMAEGGLEANTPDPVVVIQDLKGKILDKVNLSVAVQKYKLGNPQDIKKQLAHQNYTTIGNYVVVAPMSGQPQDAITQGIAEGYQLDEGAIETITALAKKIPGIGKYYQLAQQYKPQLIDILKTSKSGKEVKQKMEQLAAGQSATVAESGMMKQLGGLAVGGGSILSTMWMNAMGMIDGVLAHAAAGEVGGAVASGSILGLIPVTLMLFAAMLLFKGSKQSSDEKAQAFQAQRGQQGVAETQTDYQKRRQRERDVDAGKPVKPQPRNPQNDYFARRKKEKDLNEEIEIRIIEMRMNGYEL